MKRIWISAGFVTVIFCAISLFYFAAPPVIDDGTYASDFVALQDIQNWNWINQKEAQVIANSYFWTHISGCGIAKEPTRDGRHWISETAVGYGGAPASPILIDRRNGSVKWEKNEILTLAELQNQTANKAR